VGEHKTKRAKHSHILIFLSCLFMFVFCYCFAFGVFDCEMIFFCTVILLMLRVEKWCKCFVLITPIAPHNSFICGLRWSKCFSRRSHIGGIFINIRSYRMCCFYLKLSCKGSKFVFYFHPLTKYATPWLTWLK
jgi:hypothetical protein